MTKENKLKLLIFDIAVILIIIAAHMMNSEQGFILAIGYIVGSMISRYFD